MLNWVPLNASSRILLICYEDKRSTKEILVNHSLGWVLTSVDISTSGKSANGLCDHILSVANVFGLNDEKAIANICFLKSSQQRRSNYIVTFQIQ